MDRYNKRKRAEAFNCDQALSGFDPVDAPDPTLSKTWTVLNKRVKTEENIQALWNEFQHVANQVFTNAIDKHAVLNSTFVTAFMKEYGSEANRLCASAQQYVCREEDQAVTRILLDHDAYSPENGIICAVLFKKHLKKTHRIEYGGYHGYRVQNIYPCARNPSYTVIECHQDKELHKYHEKTCYQATSNMISFKAIGHSHVYHCCNDRGELFSGLVSNLSLGIDGVYQSNESNHSSYVQSVDIVRLIQKGYRVEDVLVGVLPDECISIIQDYMYVRQPPSYRHHALSQPADYM
jgi:hypothetical protein